MKFGKSLEFGRHGIEGLKKETDENLLDEDYSQIQGDGSEIKKLLNDLEDIEEDYEDCGKEEKEPEVEKEEDFSDCLKKQNKEIETEEDALDYMDCGKESEKEKERINDEINEIFG